MDPFSILTMLLSIIAIALTIVTTCLILKKHKETENITQIEFVLFLLAGIFLTSVGALLLVVEPRNQDSNVTCVLSIWAIAIGYAWQIVPLIIKSQAIILIVKASNQMRRVHVDKKMLLMASSLWSGVAMLYCLFWTIFGKPRVQQDEDLVYYCSWGSPAWTSVFYATIVVCYMQLGYLASKMSEAPQSISDSDEICDMIYSSSISLAFRVIVYVIAVSLPTGHLEKETIPSFFFSIEMIINLSVYFGQFFMRNKEPAKDSRWNRFRSSKILPPRVLATTATRPNATESGSPSNFVQSTRHSTVISFADGVQEEEKVEEYLECLSRISEDKKVDVQSGTSNESKEVPQISFMVGRGDVAEVHLRSNQEGWKKEISDLLERESDLEDCKRKISEVLERIGVNDVPTYHHH